MPEHTHSEKNIPLKVTQPANKAAGAQAVAKTLEYLRREPGLMKGTQGLLAMNQHGGFDCSSCAWPDPDHERSHNEYCENGAKALASEATGKKITRDFFAHHAIDFLREQTDHWHELQGRLTEPMVKRKHATHYEPIIWDEAISLIADELNKLSSPDEASFYTSGRASNEAAFLYQLIVRLYGTNNLPDCSNMCHESSGAALNKTIGIGKGTVTLEDFEKADLILIAGQNPGTNHPRMLSSLQQASRRGAKIISINLLFEAGLKAFAHPQEPLALLGKKTQIASMHVPVKPGGDLALFKGICKRLLELESANPGLAIDDSFIETYTLDAEAFKATLTKQSWDELIDQSGISEAVIDELAHLVANSKGLITCWAMGLTQHDHAVATIQEVVNLHLITGMIGKPGAGLCPVRGHSNVQGDRTMGVWEKPADSFLDKLDEHYEFKSPRRHGLDTVDTIKAMLGGEIKVFMALGGNFISAAPDTEVTAQAMETCDLTVQISTKLNRSHTITGKQALILPCLVRSEKDNDQFVTTENSMGVVQMSKGVLDPISDHVKSESRILCELGAALFPKRRQTFEAYAKDYSRIRADIEAVIPGFDSYDFKVQKPGGFYLPNGPRERNFTTDSGKAVFTVNPLPQTKSQANSQPKSQPNLLLLQTLRTHDQFNTTVYGMEDRYRGIYHDRNVIMMNEKDMRDRGIKHLDKVDIKSHWYNTVREVKNFTAIQYDMPQGACAAYFPEANVLVPLEKTAAISNTPASKSVPVSISKI